MIVRRVIHGDCARQPGCLTKAMIRPEAGSDRFGATWPMPRFLTRLPGVLAFSVRFLRQSESPPCSCHRTA